MATMARGLGPVRHVSVRRCRLSGACGTRALLVPALRAVDSTSSCPVSAASQHSRATAGTTRPSSAVVVGGVSAASPKVNLRGGAAYNALRTSIRRGVGSSSGFDYRAAPVCRLNPTRATALLLRGSHDESRRGGACSARALREWRSGGEGVGLLQFAGLRTSASVSGPAADDKKTPGVQEGGAGSSSSSGGSSSSGSSSSSRSPTPSPQAVSSTAAAAAADKIPAATGAQSAEKGETVKGGNPACRRSDGSFIHMRERMRQGRLGASEDAKDWMRDKRDDMNTMKETLRDARQDLRDARRDGRLGKEISEQAKESSGRVQVLWRQYGAVGIGTYFGIYFGSIAFFYVVYDYGVLTNLPSGGTAVIEHMKEWMKNAPEWAQGYSHRLFGAMVEDHRARSLVLAWATCKVIEPLRLLGAIAITPRMARALGRAPSNVADDDDSEDDSSRGKDGEGSGIEDADADRSGGGGGGGSSSGNGVQSGR